MRNEIQTENPEVNSKIYSWLYGTPPSDVNFQHNLKKANVATIREVLKNIPDKDNATRRKVLEARLRRLENKAAIEKYNAEPSEANAKNYARSLEKLADAERGSRAAEDEIFSDDKIFSIHLSNIIVSPFEPQARRRAKFARAETEELGNSIVKQGLFSPIVVRFRRDMMRYDKGNVYEIVFGERRYLAHKIKNLPTIKCFVRELTDAEVIELQYEENHRRQKNDPLDDAFYFQYLKEKEGYTDEDLADRLATTIQNVREKLKLNDLITEAKQELTDGSLPLRHAYYLAKFPAETQKEIVREQYAYRHYDRDEKAVSFEVFRDEVEENVLRRLIDSPFDVADQRLHVKGLLCRDCPDNSAYATHLFPELAAAPRCLNKACFQIKTNTHLRLQREEIAAARPNPTNLPAEEIISDVPLVTERRYTSERVPFSEKVLTSQVLLEKPECESSVLSVAVEGTRKGQKVYVCQKNDCPVHHPQPSPEDFSDDELTEIEIDFERRVADGVRLKVLEAACQWFDDYKTFWTFDDLIKNLIVAFFAELNYRHGDEFLLTIRALFPAAPKSFNDESPVREFINDLSKTEQSQILFLLSTRGVAADEVGLVKILKDYTRLDFFTLDAETRLELAPEEFKQQAKEYLEAVRSGNLCDVPRFWRNYDRVPVISEEN